MESARALFPAADGKRAGVRLEIEVVVRIAQRRELGGELQFLFGQEILVFDHAGGQIDAGQAADALGPQARAVDQDVAADVATARHHADRAPAFERDLLDAHALFDLVAPCRRAPLA